MPEMLVNFIVYVGELLLVGVLFGLPLALIAWIRPIRRWALSGPRARAGLVWVLATTSFFLSYIAVGRLVAQGAYVLGTGMGPTEEEVLNKTAIVNELWRQLMLFPFARGECVSGRERICQLAAGVWPYSTNGVQARDYMLLPELGLASGVATAVWVGLITRSRKKALDSQGDPA
ncbi:MAG TPA: hypothetical protein VJ123_07560 [Anaerolineales bacterium]|nr:hypothetical protein [Anaerolineales bacterium]